MRTLFKILGFALILYSIFEVGLHIKADIEKSAYWRGVDDARTRCYEAHRQCLADSMDERMKADIAVAQKKFKGGVK